MLFISKRELFILLLLSVCCTIIPMDNPENGDSKTSSEPQDRLNKSFAELVGLMKNMGICGDHSSSCPIDQIKVDMGTIAAQNGDLESLKHFIDSSNVNKLSGKISALDAVILFAYKNKDETKYLPLFEYLFALGAIIQTPAKGTTVSPLGIATTYGCLVNYTRPIEILLERGGNPFTPCTKDTTTAAQLCIFSKLRQDTPGADSVLQLFQKKATDLDQAIECLHIEKIAQLANPAAIKELEQKSKNSLARVYGMWAQGIKETLPVFSILFKNGIRPEDELPNVPLPGYTLLVAATKNALTKGDSSLLELCLSHKADPSYKAFPMAPSAIDITKVFASMEPNNPNVAKVRALLNTNA